MVMGRRKAPEPASSGFEHLFTQLDRETYLARLLGGYGVHVFLGTSTTESRKANLRAAIVDLGLSDRVAVQQRGLTFSECFEKTYSEPLRQMSLI
jgi:hypothetical protein